MTETKVTYPVQMPLDGRTWWGVCGGDADEKLVCAKNARSAIAVVKRAWIAADRANGSSLAWAVQTVAAAKWKAAGPFTTPQAYHRARKQMLWEVTENTVFASVDPKAVDNREVMIEWLGEQRLDQLEARIAKQFTDPARVIV